MKFAATCLILLMAQNLWVVLHQKPGRGRRSGRRPRATRGRGGERERLAAVACPRAGSRRGRRALRRGPVAEAAAPLVRAPRPAIPVAAPLVVRVVAVGRLPGGPVPAPPGGGRTDRARRRSAARKVACAQRRGRSAPRSRAPRSRAIPPIPARRGVGDGTVTVGVLEAASGRGGCNTWGHWRASWRRRGHLGDEAEVFLCQSRHPHLRGQEVRPVSRMRSTGTEVLLQPCPSTVALRINLVIDSRCWLPVCYIQENK